MEWKLRNRSLFCDASRPLIMGILNLTPDSFSDGGRYDSLEKALDRALELEAQGADILDVGGESTRPNAEVVSEKEELRRVIPVIESLRGKLKIPISIDTTKSKVAREAFLAGAEILNDVSAFEWDLRLLETIVELKGGYVLMHSQGSPQTMQIAPRYENVVEEVLYFLKKKVQIVEQAGLSHENVVIDMGFGFGKTMEDNFALLKNVSRFKELNRPILLGLSRKSFLKNLVGAETLEFAGLLGAFFGALQGGSLWRVHDVLQAVGARKMLKALGETR